MTKIENDQDQDQYFDFKGAPAFSRTPEQGGSRTFFSSKTYD